LADTPLFPANVREVLDFVTAGDILRQPYSGGIAPEMLIKDAKKALRLYGDQDAKPPRHFLPDITESAAGDIPFGDEGQQALKRGLREHEEQTDFCGAVLQKISRYKKEWGLKKNEITVLADAIGNSLYLCAKARLLTAQPHPYFEKLFAVIKNQGFPCGWSGQDNWRSGEFIVFSR
jgi:hypothetical protein